MTALDDLLATEAIRLLKARYFRAMDTKDWNLLADVFCEDAFCDYTQAMTDPATPPPSGAAQAEGEHLLQGRAAIIAYISAGLTPLRSVHQGFMPEITVTGPDTASAIWPMADRLTLPPDSPVAEIHGYGHYHETYRKVAGQWKIATLRLTRLRVAHVPG
ncbi:nuclear transport factor 2 family protein [Novosphingobium rosa]|uniref:nuclear transport factor 2 family protein n=1 Tax=Novosphingobium rosa TaxID=76978 RepID=UPI0008302957|nr:nuclear transport factor 2 family protein [Novosphingobium rosa]